jgi:hypothetical protein
MRTRLRRRHKSSLIIYSGGGLLERRYLKKGVRKTRRQIDRILTRESLAE